MTESVIPVDPRNPGQVLACLGFMEAALVLLPEAEIEAGFDWSAGPCRFRLRAGGTDALPVREVLGFLAAAEVVAVAPEGVPGDWPDGAVAQPEFPGPATEKGKPVSASALPVRLVAGGRALAVTHWADGTREETCKTFAGQQVGTSVLAGILGAGGRPPGPGTLRALFRAAPGLAEDPLTPSLPVSAAFGFDARGAWEAVQSGISLNELGLPVAVSPAVEALAPLGLEHARPATVPPRTLRYAIWPGLLPPALARLVFATPDALPGIALRRFRTHTGADKYYKKFFPAIEE